jgi:DNA-binding transcriptional regulator Cro
VDYVIIAFGGPAELGKALQISSAAVSQWKERQCIPTKRISQILKIAGIRGLDITHKDLIEGRDV